MLLYLLANSLALLAGEIEGDSALVAMISGTVPSVQSGGMSQPRAL